MSAIKKNWVITVAYIVLCSLFFTFAPRSVYTISDLGAPLCDVYPQNELSTLSNDIVFYDGCLHISGGDYDKNTGPVPAYRYDEKSGMWKSGGCFDDEAILRFGVCDGVLCATGADAKEDWELGNYYTFENGEWIKHRIIPGGVHVFDMLSFDNDLFFGIGTDGDTSSVVRQAQNGYEAVPFIGKDGLPLVYETVSDVRTYDIFSQNGSLYAVKYGASQLFKYENGVFSYLCDWGNFNKWGSGGEGGTIRKQSFAGSLYIASKRLYVWRGSGEPEISECFHNTVVADLYEKDGFLYVMTEHSEGETFVISVHRSADGERFDSLFSFTSVVPATAFAISDKAFYFSMMYNRKSFSENGHIYKLTIRN